MGAIKLLVLAGGKSSRMGSPKHMLSLPSGRPLYTRIASVLYESCPGSTVHVSLAQDSVFDHVNEGALADEPIMVQSEAGREIPIKVIYDEENGDVAGGDTPQIGPAAGLLAAHREDPHATWMLVACDYPLVTVQALKQLRDAHTEKSAVTCFRNAEGYVEPLLAIWSPEALKRLRENVDKGKLGPSFTVKEMDGNILQPAGSGETDLWLWNANDPNEWTKCREILEQWHGRNRA